MARSSRSVSRHVRGRGRRHGYRYAKPAAVIIILAAIAYGAYSFVAVEQSISPYTQVNLVLQDVAQLIPSENYTPIQVNNITSLSSQLSNRGFEFVSVSEFNGTEVGQSSSHPATIMSVVYVTNSTYSASRLASGLVATESSPSASMHTQTGLYESNYTYNGTAVSMFTTSFITIYNSTVAQAASIKFPVFQSVTTFAYGGMVGLVTTAGYSGLNDTYSLMLARRLVAHMASSPAAPPR